MFAAWRRLRLPVPPGHDSHLARQNSRRRDIARAAQGSGRGPHQSCAELYHERDEGIPHANRQRRRPHRELYWCPFFAVKTCMDGLVPHGCKAFSGEFSPLLRHMVAFGFQVPLSRSTCQITSWQNTSSACFGIDAHESRVFTATEEFLLQRASVRVPYADALGAIQRFRHP